ncbi:MAG: adenylyl-sulfate kinase [Bacteroidetes bacterium]|nr:adenylyl-sulfate kinase [Bacteroidota bacterium]
MELYFSDSKPIGRTAKELRLKQKAKVLWMTGLSGSGKTTLGLALEKELYRQGFLVMLLDGDLVRTGINNNLRFSVEDRKENIRRIAEISKLFVNCGIVTINCFISPTDEIRTMAKNIIGQDDYLEVFIDAPIEVCETRDVKGLYAKARRGEVQEFTGISSPFDIPPDPDLVLRTDIMSIEESVQLALEFILPKITLQE